MCYGRGEMWYARMFLTEQRAFECLLLYEAAGSVSFTQREEQSHLLKGLKWISLTNTQWPCLWPCFVKLRNPKERMRTITSFRSSNNRGVESSVDGANKLNLFLNRFDTAGPALPRPDSSAAGSQQPTPLNPPSPS
ncbi:hypothetical protein AOLI_G00254670 [Acnodon oligacanthus]